MIIFRYLAKEVMTTLAAITSILLFIFMSNQGVQYLNRAANGHLPGAFLLKIMLLEIPNLLALLVPLGFYMALMLAYGRLYADSEMTALSAGGYGPNRLLAHSLFMAVWVAILVGVLVCWGGPWVATERAKILRSTGLQTLIHMVMPGRFQSLQNGQVVFYVESMTQHPKMGHHIFVAKQAPTPSKINWQVLWAEDAYVARDKATTEDYIVLEKGRGYIGSPGQADLQLIDFKTYQLRLPHAESSTAEDIRTIPMSELFAHYGSDVKMAAELQWRFSIPMMVIMLTWVAVPLSRVNPRSGKYANILPAILIFIFYANLMFVGRNWIVSGFVPAWLAPVCLHGSIGLIGLFLWRRNLKVGR